MRAEQWEGLSGPGTSWWGGFGMERAQGGRNFTAYLSEAQSHENSLEIQEGPDQDAGLSQDFGLCDGWESGGGGGG